MTKVEEKAIMMASEEVKEKSEFEFTFKRKKYKILPFIGFQTKIDAANELTATTLIANHEHGTTYVSADFQAMNDLIMMSYCTTMKIDFALPPETLYKLYDELSESGIISKVYEKSEENMNDIYMAFKRMLSITEGEIKASFEEKRHLASFGVYAKEFLASILGEGDFKAIIAESTGLIGGLREVMGNYRALSGEVENKGLPAKTMKDNIINLTIRDKE